MPPKPSENKISPKPSIEKTATTRKTPKTKAQILPAPPPDGVVHKIDPSLLGMAVRLSEIAPDPANERTHSRQNLDAIRASLTKYGQREPLVVNRRTGLIEAGHGRYVVMQELGWEYAAAVLVDEDAKSASGYRVAANRSAELAEWDDVRLLATLTELGEGSLGDVGFTLAELKKIESLVNPPETSPNEQARLDLKKSCACPKCGHEFRVP